MALGRACGLGASAGRWVHYDGFRAEAFGELRDLSNGRSGKCRLAAIALNLPVKT